MAKKKGRPPKFESPEEMQQKIEAYFESRKAPLLDKNGRAVLDSNGEPIMVDSKPCTITGLALALGFTSRQDLLNYQAKADFFDTVTRAKSKVEEYAESRLFDRDGAVGAKFALANNYDGWKERQELDQNIGGKDGKPFDVTLKVVE